MEILQKFEDCRKSYAELFKLMESSLTSDKLDEELVKLNELILNKMNDCQNRLESFKTAYDNSDKSSYTQDFKDEVNGFFENLGNKIKSFLNGVNYKRDSLTALKNETLESLQKNSNLSRGAKGYLRVVTNNSDPKFRNNI